eukprot:gene9075-1387_t
MGWDRWVGSGSRYCTLYCIDGLGWDRWVGIDGLGLAVDSARCTVSMGWDRWVGIDGLGWVGLLVEWLHLMSSCWSSGWSSGCSSGGVGCMGTGGGGL